jgi:hypothetical protein
VRRGVTTSKVSLTPKEIMTPSEISDIFTDINIEGENVEQTILRLMATQTANDMEELFINGDTLGIARLESDLIDGGSSTQYIKDTYMALFDGWIRLADSANIYDAGGADVSSTIFSRMINAMPNKFRRIRGDLRFLCSLDHEQLYREKIASRPSGAGDTALSSSGELKPFGIPLVGIPLLESEPRIVEHITFAAAPDTQSLRYGPVGSWLVITPSTLAGSPTTPYIEDTDYTVDRTAGSITTIDTAGLDAGGTVKVSYQSAGQVLLTNYQNLILGIGRDVRMERDRDIFKGTNQFAITTKIAVQIEEVTAVVKGINIGLN